MFNLILPFVLNYFLPLSVKVVKAYVDSTETKNDDKILEVSKIGVEYLAEKTNNNITVSLSQELNQSKMVKIQGN